MKIPISSMQRKIVSLVCVRMRKEAACMRKKSNTVGMVKADIPLLSRAALYSPHDTALAARLHGPLLLCK